MTLTELADRLEVVEGGNILRFSICDLGGGRQGYRWGSVTTGSIEKVELLCAMWNHRKDISEALLKGLTP